MAAESNVKTCSLCMARALKWSGEHTARRTLTMMVMGAGLATSLAIAALDAQGGDAEAPLQASADNPAPIAKAADHVPTVSADVSLRSAYVSRGEVLSDHPVVQPQIVVSKFGFNIGIWANDELTDRSIGRYGFSEIDLMLNYELPVKPVDIIVGIIEYEYPCSGSETLDDGTQVQLALPSTREVFLTATWVNPWLTPGVEVYYDFGEADGFYVEGMLEHEFTMAPGWAFTPGVSSGWGSRNFNEYSFGAALNTLIDGNLYAKLEYAWKDGVKLGADICYTWLWDGEIRSNAAEVYMDNRQLSGGVTMTYDF